jgi:predicted nucleotidyltransferase
MGIPKYIVRENQGLGDWCILHGYRGSIAHGMYVPNSNPNSIDDKDTMAICVPPKEYYYGLREYGSRGTKEIMKDVWDIVIYELRKFVSLLTKGNPNVLSLLWLEDKYYIKATEAGRLLVDNKELFVGKHVYQSFTGYAYSQLKRMENHAFEGYMGAKRKNLVEKFGYDTKNAAHLVRLLRMAIEFMTDGFLEVERHDAPQLLQIKNGEWTLGQVKTEADRLFALSDAAYIASKLPRKPDMDKINQLLVNVIEIQNG